MRSQAATMLALLGLILFPAFWSGCDRPGSGGWRQAEADPQGSPSMCDPKVSVCDMQACAAPETRVGSESYLTCNKQCKDHPPICPTMCVCDLSEDETMQRCQARASQDLQNLMTQYPNAHLTLNITTQSACQCAYEIYGVPSRNC